MTPKTRLSLVACLIILSAVYAFLVAYNPSIARTAALGYICLMLTALVLISCFKGPPRGGV